MLTQSLEAKAVSIEGKVPGMVRLPLSTHVGGHPGLFPSRQGGQGVELRYFSSLGLERNGVDVKGIRMKTRADCVICVPYAESVSYISLDSVLFTRGRLLSGIGNWPGGKSYDTRNKHASVMRSPLPFLLEVIPAGLLVKHNGEIKEGHNFCRGMLLVVSPKPRSSFT